jgi:ubiquinone/menaquinone biosynthesis C-methylase UbiE
MSTIQEIIMHFINQYDYKSYLSITDPFKIECDLVKAVLPEHSQDFYSSNTQKFDIIYVDCLHVESVVDHHLAECIKILSPKGILLINNCLPRDQSHIRSYEEYLKNQYSWTGDVWKSVLKYQPEIIDMEWGVAIIPSGSVITNPSPTWEDFLTYEKILRLRDFYDKYFDISKYRYLREIDPTISVPEMEKKMIAESKDKLDMFSNMIKTNKNFTLVKFHDGELTNMTTPGGEMNSFKFLYSRKLGDDLVRAFIYLVKNKNGYVHFWHYTPYKMLTNILRDLRVDWDAKLVYCEATVQKLPFIPGQVNFFKTIQQSPRKKIYICNKMIAPYVKTVLKVDNIILIDSINFYASEDLFYPEKERVLTEIKNLLNEIKTDDNILLFSAGLGSKVMITDLMKTHSNNTYLDLGSTFDGLSHATRDYNCMPGYKQILWSTYMS